MNTNKRLTFTGSIYILAVAAILIALVIFAIATILSQAQPSQVQVPNTGSSVSVDQTARINAAYTARLREQADALTSSGSVTTAAQPAVSRSQAAYTARLMAQAAFYGYGRR